MTVVMDLDGKQFRVKSDAFSRELFSKAATLNLWTFTVS